MKILIAPDKFKGTLTAREREVLTRLAFGRSTDEVAAELFLSRQTVHTHVRNAIARLGARNRVHAVAIAAAAGEITLGAT